MHPLVSWLSAIIVGGTEQVFLGKQLRQSEALAAPPRVSRLSTAFKKLGLEFRHDLFDDASTMDGSTLEKGPVSCAFHAYALVRRRDEHPVRLPPVLLHLRGVPSVLSIVYFVIGAGTVVATPMSAGLRRLVPQERYEELCIVAPAWPLF